MNNKLVLGENVEIHIIEKKELDLIMDFQKDVIDDMENKEWFSPLTKDEFLSSIEGVDNAYFFTYGNEIVGLLVLTCNIPDVLDEYRLPNNNYMLIDSIMVKKEYRGNGMQRQMLKFAFERAVQLNMDGLVATVHPDNIYSLKNFIEDGYETLHVLTIHGGIRHIMIKNVFK